MHVIHVARDGSKLGEFTDDEIREGLRSGRFSGTDPAWTEGMADWKPLAEWPDYGPVVPPLPAAAPPPPPPWPVPAPVAETDPEVPHGVPWEQREALGWIRAFGGTIAAVLLRPGETFGRMRHTGGLLEPLLFYALLAIPGSLIATLYQTGFELISKQETREAILAGFAAGMVASFLTPLLLLAISGLQHLTLHLMGGAHRPFETTLRTAAYAGGAPCVLELIPCCGPFAAAVWGIAALCIGLTRTQKCSTGQAVIAALAPLALCCVLILGGVGIAAAMGALVSMQFMK